MSGDYGLCRKNSLNRKGSAIKGLLAGILSAIFFGLAPTFTKLAYQGGSNTIMVILIRSLFSLPLLYLPARRSARGMKLGRREWPWVVGAGLFGIFLTSTLLNASYHFINVGVSTVLHFIFPVLVMLASLLFFRERLRWWKILALVFGLGGVFTFLPSSGLHGLWGLVLALGSGFTYAALLIAIERSRLKTIPAFKLAFYYSLVSLAGALLSGWATGSLTLELSFAAWVYSIVITLLVPVLGFSLLSFAIVRCGATTTAIVSMLEPVTSLLFSYLIFREPLTPLMLVGFLFIMAAILILAFFSSQSGRRLP